jgi:membrane-associated phospholipid phosphatase
MPNHLSNRQTGLPAGQAGMSVLLFLRLWYPVLSYTFIYQELEILNSFFTEGSYDESILALEELVFRGQPSLWFSEVFQISLLSEYFHLSYFSYYFLIPSLGFTLYFKKRLDEFRLFVFSLTAGFFFCYLIFIFYPVHGPFYQFEVIGPPLSRFPFYKLTHFIVGRWDSSGTAFPSSHVAVALLVLLWAKRYEKRVFRILAPFVTGLIVGTVYGRFHYAVDALVTFYS